MRWSDESDDYCDCPDPDADLCCEDNVMDFLKTLLSGAVGAGIVAGLFTLFGKRMDQTHEEKKDKMNELKDLRGQVADLQKQMSQTRQRLDDMDKSDRALLKAVNALLLHSMSGNATGKMAKAQEELTNFIISKGE